METDRNWNAGATGRSLKDEARTQAHKAKDQVREIANSGREQIANQMDSVARALRGAGDRLRDEENAAQAGYYTDLISEKAERVASYLRERDAIDLVDEAEDFARTKPLVFLGGCVAVGFLLGRFLRATPSEQLPLGIESGGMPQSVASPYGTSTTPTYGTPDYGGYGQYDTRIAGGVTRTPEPEVARPPVVTTPIVSTPEPIVPPRRGGNGSEGG